MIWESEWADWDELMDMVPRKRLTMGWEDDAWARGGVRLLPLLAGHGWTIWEMVSIALFFFIFWKSMEIAGKVLEWWKVPCSTVTRLELRGQGPHMLWTPPWGFLPMQHINNCWDWWCSQLQGALWVWSIVWSRTQDRGV